MSNSRAAICFLHGDCLTEVSQGKRYLLRFLKIKHATADLSFECKVSKKEKETSTSLVPTSRQKSGYPRSEQLVSACQKRGKEQAKCFR